VATRLLSRPKHLPAKLLAIRHKLRASRFQLAKLLEFNNSAARISEYETGVREPDLLVLLSYAKLARISMDVLLDDNVGLKFSKNWKPPTKRELRD
jgi:transcriptional regulator with XRE-family HTH domain